MIGAEHSPRRLIATPLAWPPCNAPLASPGGSSSCSLGGSGGSGLGSRDPCPTEKESGWSCLLMGPAVGTIARIVIHEALAILPPNLCDLLRHLALWRIT